MHLIFNNTCHVLSLARVQPALPQLSLWCVFSNDIMFCHRSEWVFWEFVVWRWAGRWAYTCVCVSAALIPSKRPAPHNRKRRGEARVYGLTQPQKSLLFFKQSCISSGLFSQIGLAWNALTLAQGQENMTAVGALNVVWTAEGLPVPVLQVGLLCQPTATVLNLQRLEWAQTDRNVSRLLLKWAIVVSSVKKVTYSLLCCCIVQLFVLVKVSRVAEPKEVGSCL